MHPRAPKSFIRKATLADNPKSAYVYLPCCAHALAAEHVVHSTDPGAGRPSGKAQIAKQLQSAKARQTDGPGGSVQEQSGREDLRAALMTFMCRTSGKASASPDENGDVESTIASGSRSWAGKKRAGKRCDEHVRCCDPSFDFG